MGRMRLIGAALVLLLVVIGSRPVSAQQNLLRNPGFEGSYSAWSGINEIQMAPEWTPWWVEDPGHNPPYFRPEYKRADGALFPNRVYEGGAAQQYFTFSASHVAGFYQQVFGVTPGQRYQFSIYVQVWSSNADDPNTSVGPANPRLHVGIDPTGNWNAGASTVVWSPEAPMDQVIDRWGRMTVEAVAQNDVITVMVRTRPDFPNKHNDTYWDAAALIAVSGAQPSPTAEPIVQPSPTTQPSPTGQPSPTPGPSATSVAGPTATPVPCGVPEGWVPYTVVAGNTLFRLALNTGTTVDEVVRANCLASTAIFVGQQLYLPVAPATATATATPPATATPVPSTITPTGTAPAEPSATPTSVPPASPTIAPTATPEDTPTAESEPTEVAVVPEPTGAPPATVAPAPTVATDVEDGAGTILGVDTTLLLGGTVGLLLLMLVGVGFILLRRE